MQVVYCSQHFYVFYSKLKPKQVIKILGYLSSNLCQLQSLSR